MGLRKSYTVNAVLSEGLSMVNFDNLKVSRAAGESIYLDSDIGDLMTDFVTLNVEWQTLTADVDNGSGDISLTDKTIKGIANTEYVVKVNTAVSGNMDVATSTIVIKAYDSSDTLLETRTIALPTINDTNRDDYVNLSSLLGASYIVVDGTMKEATGDYEATITVSLENVAEIPAGCIFTIGAEAADVINLGIQLLASDGSELSGRGIIDFYLSDDALGNSVSSTAETIAIGTDGAILASKGNLQRYLSGLPS